MFSHKLTLLFHIRGKDLGKISASLYLEVRMYEEIFLKGICKVWLRQEKMVQFYCKCSKQFSKFLDTIPFIERNASMKAHSNSPTKKDLNNAGLDVHTGFF